MKTHIASVHEGKKRFQCDICFTGFKQTSKLKLHISEVHEGKRPYSCEICQKTFKQKSKLNRHLKEVHKGMKRSENNGNVISPILLENKGV